MVQHIHLCFTIVLAKVCEQGAFVSKDKTMPYNHASSAVMHTVDMPEMANHPVIQVQCNMMLCVKSIG